MKLSKEKRDQLILACVGTLILLTCIWYFWINPRYAAIKSIGHNINDKQVKLQDIQKTIADAAAAADQLREATNALFEAEKDLAVGDPNAWIYDTMRHF